MNREDMEKFIATNAGLSEENAADVLQTLIEGISSNYNKNEKEEDEIMLFGNKENYNDKKSIVIYFSRADENYSVGYIEKGNTEVIAEYIHDIIGADLFKVEPAIPYAKDYTTCIEEAKDRQASHHAPIVMSVPDLSAYEVVYIGAPVYWGVMPEELVTALKDIDFSGKVIRPFVTHEGSGLANIPAQIRNVCKGANVVDGLAIQGTLVNSSKPSVENWI